MPVESDEIEIEDNPLCSEMELDEYLRLDNAFRMVSATYALLCDTLSRRKKVSERDKRLILNLSADLQHKARRLMQQSPSLRGQAAKHLAELWKEVA